MTTLQPAETSQTKSTKSTEPPAPRSRVRFAWYAYDWANSVFTTIVTSMFFGPYLTGITKDAADPAGFVHPLGLSVRAESFYPFLVALSLILQVLVLPAAGALARRVPRNLLLGGLAMTGGMATVGLALVSQVSYVLGGLLFVVATLALGASVVVYDTYLPEIASPRDRADVSSRGTAAGYLGTVVLLVVSISVVLAREALGLSEDAAAAVCLMLAGLWWAGFTVLPVRGLPSTTLRAARTGTGFGEFRGMLTELVRDRRRAAVFLVAFLLYNSAILVISSQGTTFVTEELDVSQDLLVVGVLLVSMTAVLGTVIGGRLASRFGAPIVLLGGLAVWLVVVGLQVTARPGAMGVLVVMGILVGLVNGTCYALSRAVFANLTPADRSAEYFSLFEMVNRSFGALGVIVFGAVVQVTGSYRLAIGTMSILFLSGAVLLTVAVVRRAGALGGGRDD